jgi:hypothetical protein
MKTALTFAIGFAVFGRFVCPNAAHGGTWNDHFLQPALATDWTGNLSDFQLKDGILIGQSASPLSSPLNFLEIAADSTNCDVACWINIVEPNTRVCTKGALLLRHSGNDGYVFALHEPTRTIEVYRLSTRQRLLEVNARIELKQWYYLRAELRGPMMRFFVDGKLVGTVTDSQSSSGSVGIAVQDAEIAWFDDFSVTGPNIVGNVDDIELPVINVVPQNNGNVVLSFLATPPYDYSVLASSNAFGHEWQTIGTFRAKLSSYQAEFTDPITNSHRFYRIEKTHCGCR